MYASYGMKLDDVRRPLFRFRGSLAQQFLLVAFGVMLAGMLAMGILVSKTIERGVAEVNAASAALFINNFVAPHLQELASSDSLALSRISISSGGTSFYLLILPDYHKGVRLLGLLEDLLCCQPDGTIH